MAGTRVLMQEPAMLRAFEEANAEPDLAFGRFAGGHNATEHLGAANRLEMLAF